MVIASIASCERGAREERADSVALTRDTSALSQTDSLAYAITLRDGRYTGRALVRFHNRTADTAYFVNCNGATSVQLQRDVGGVWVDAWTSAQDACLSPPIVVLPGDTLDRPVLFFDGYQPDTAATPAAERGVYRLVWTALVHHYQSRTPVGVELPLPRRISNRFVLTGAPR